MNKQRNQFAALPQADRDLILDLCARNPYEEVVAQLAKSRAEGGLGILTSKSALCRFYTTAQPDQNLVLLAQAAAAAQVRHEQHSNAFLGAIRAAVEARIFENLQLGKALGDMEKDFRLLKTTEQLYLADARWRAGNPAARAAYQEHVNRCAQAPEHDFIPAEDAARIAEPIAEPSQFEKDVAHAREKQQRDQASRQEILTILSRANPNSNPKTPAIPPIPLNSTSPAPLPQAIRNPPAPAPQERVTPTQPPLPTGDAHRRADSLSAQTSAPPKENPTLPVTKIGRNDTCPCGSGQKYKKCCLLKPSRSNQSPRPVSATLPVDSSPSAR